MEIWKITALIGSVVSIIAFLLLFNIVNIQNPVKYSYSTSIVIGDPVQTNEGYFLNLDFISDTGAFIASRKVTVSIKICPAGKNASVEKFESRYGNFILIGDKNNFARKYPYIEKDENECGVQEVAGIELNRSQLKFGDRNITGATGRTDVIFDAPGKYSIYTLGFPDKEILSSETKIEILSPDVGIQIDSNKQTFVITLFLVAFTLFQIAVTLYSRKHNNYVKK